MNHGQRLALLSWFDVHKRDLPWRRTREPYAVWVSEVMLQQTQVDSVVPYFDFWMARFPTVESLATADEQEALSLWQGLGYYRRCRMLLQGARSIAEQGWPSSAREWLAVTGIGRYTANAIASIACGESVPVVDGNVERVFARLTGCREARPKLNKVAWEWAEANLVSSRPGDWNQALMELGATVCTPVAPTCARCPLHRPCVARAEGTFETLPAKKRRPPTVCLLHTVWIPICNGRFGVRQIPKGEWWQGMWEFPRTSRYESLEAWTGPVELHRLTTINHTVTHHRIQVDAFLALCDRRTDCLRWLTPEELARIPMPAPQRKLAVTAVDRLASRDAGGR